MSSRAALLMFSATSWLPILAQDPPGPISPTPLLVTRKTPAATPSPASPAVQRAKTDALRACRSALEAAHGFRGTCRFTTDVVGRGDPTDLEFVGGWADGLEYFAFADHRILRHGDVHLVSRQRGPWTLPQGDSPDCPLAPVVIARFLPLAFIHSAEPSAFAERPAMRVHATWTGESAALLTQELHHPAAQTEGLLEQLTAYLLRPPQDRISVDATVCFDPARKRLYTATVRVALLPDQPDREPEDEPDAAATPAAGTEQHGLPLLPRRPMAQFLFTITLADAADLPMPALDEATKARLAWPPPTIPPPLRRE